MPANVRGGGLCSAKKCDIDGVPFWLNGVPRAVHLSVSEFPSSKDWLLVANTAYHTSVVTGGEEYYFDPQGVQKRPFPWKPGSIVPASHTEKRRTVVFEVGQTTRTGAELLASLTKYFAPGSYDIVQKNCNAFTDCTLAFFLSRRLPRRYMAAELLGRELSPSIVNFASGGRYKANPLAQNFDLEGVVLRVDENAWMGTSELLAHPGAPHQGDATEATEGGEPLGLAGVLVKVDNTPVLKTKR